MTELRFETTKVIDHLLVRLKKFEKHHTYHSGSRRGNISTQWCRGHSRGAHRLVKRDGSLALQSHRAIGTARVEGRHHPRLASDLRGRCQLHMKSGYSPNIGSDLFKNLLTTDTEEERRISLRAAQHRRPLATYHEL